MSDNKADYDRDDQQGTTNQPGASSDLLVVEHNSVDVRAVELVFTATAANFFDVVERDQDGSNPTTIKSYRLDSGGQIRISESFEEPIFDLGTDREIALQNRNDDSSGDVSASYSFYERRE